MNLDRLTTQLVKDEGLRLLPYKDSVGVLTIGVGHNLNVPITTKAALYILNDDIETAIKSLDTYIPWWRSLSDLRQEVLINMCFNIGIQKLLGFTHTLAAIRGGNYADAARFMLDSLWAKQVGDRAVRLSQMMLNG